MTSETVKLIYVGYQFHFSFLYPVLCRWKSGESAWKVAMTRSFRFEFCQSIQLTKPDSVQPFIENKFQIRQVIIDSMSVIPVLVLHKAVVEVSNIGNL